MSKQTYLTAIKNYKTLKKRYLKSFFVGISLLLFRLFKFQTGYIAEQEQNNGITVVLHFYIRFG